MHDLGDILFGAAERASPICGCGLCTGSDECGHCRVFAGGLSLPKCCLRCKLGHLGVRRGAIGTSGLVGWAIGTVNPHCKTETDPRRWSFFPRTGPRCNRLRRRPDCYFGGYPNGFVFGDRGAVIDFQRRPPLSASYRRHWYCGGNCVAAPNEQAARCRSASGGFRGSKQGYGGFFGAWNAILRRLPHDSGRYHARGIYARQV